MFCPKCHDEYRPGFARCATCDVDLVETLDAAAASAPKALLPEIAAEEATANFCGFLTLDEAREARDKVRAAAMPVDILIRDVSNPAADEPLKEEFWLRVRPRDFRAIVGIIGFTPASAEEPAESFKCSACGAMVSATDETCPDCGLGFAG